MIRIFKISRTHLCVMVVLACFAATAQAQTASPNLTGTPAADGAGVSAAPRSNDSIPRYEVFMAPSYLSTPKLNLVQRGFNGDFGVNLKRWLSIGADYSALQGHSNVTAQELTPALQMQLASVVPPGMAVSVPFAASAYTFGAGPQFSFRRVRRVYFFVRPAGGLLHESITLKPNNLLTTALVAEIVPTRKKSDLTIFYGAGCGFELNTSKHVAVRFAVDFVHFKLFSELLAQGQNGVRISIAPLFRFGRNIN